MARADVKDERRVAVVGGGIVGISCAIHLQRKGWHVSLVEPGAPGQQTSRGNAGVISAGAMVPLNTPRLLRNLPKYALGHSTAIRFDPGYLLQNLGWVFRFVSRARRSKAVETARNLSALSLHSRDAHLALMKDAGLNVRFRDTGWLKLFRTRQGFESCQFDIEIYGSHGVQTQKLSRDDVADLEPCLKPVFEGGYWIKDAHSVDDPGQVAAGYAELFQREGGAIVTAGVTAIEPMSGQGRDGFGVVHDGGRLEAEQVVVAAGPWSADVLRPLGYDFPLVCERGYSAHYRAEAGAFLNRPLHDLDCGYALSQMERGFRVTSGVELAPRDNPPTPVQLNAVLPRVREAFPLEEASVDNHPWNGSRPSMPDAMPVIGPAPRHPGLWLAFGHGHIGFGTGPITGQTIAEMVNGETPGIDTSAFAPSRFC